MGNKESSALSEEDLRKYEATTHLDSGELRKVYSEWKSTSRLDREIDKKKFKELAKRVGLLDNAPNVAAEKDLPLAVVETALVDEMFTLFDIDKSGKISFDEFVSGVSLMNKGTETEQYEAIFRWRDKDGDGRLNKAELYESLEHTMKAAKKMIDSSMPHLVKTKGVDGAKKVKALVETWNDQANLKKFVDQIFEAADKDRGGTITFDEFKTFVDSNPAWLDVFQQIRKK